MSSRHPIDRPARVVASKEGSKPSPDWMVGWKIVAIIATGLQVDFNLLKDAIARFQVPVSLARH